MNFWEFPVGQWLGLGTFTAVEPGSALDQGTKILQAVHQPKKKTKRINFWRKVLKNLQSSKPVFLHIYFIGFFYISVVYFKCKWMRYLHSFTHYIKNYPGKIFLLKRKFVLLLLLCRIVVTEKQQTVQRQLCWFTILTWGHTEGCERKGDFSILEICLTGLLGSSMQVTASATYLSSGLFTHLSVFLKGLFKQLHPTLVSLFSLQFLWNVSSVPKNWEIYYWFINSLIHKWVRVCVSVCLCVCAHACFESI